MCSMESEPYNLRFSVPASVASGTERIFLLGMFKRKQWGSLEKFLSESVTADVHIHCQSRQAKWREAEIVKNPKDIKHLARFIFYTHNGCLPSVWSLGWKYLSLILLWFSVHRELLFHRSIKLNMKTILSAFVKECFFFLFSFKEPIFYSNIYTIYTDCTVNVQLM